MSSKPTPSGHSAMVGADRASSVMRALLRTDALTRPPESMDALLDATERCVARHGFARTSMSDLARELGVSRPTVYRQVDSVEDALVLVASRLTFQFMDELGVALMVGGAQRDAIVDAMVGTVTMAREHPLIRRLLDHEPAMVGSIISSGLAAATVDRIAGATVPLIQAGIAVGRMQQSDPRITAEWLARMLLDLILLSTHQDLKAMVGAAADYLGVSGD